MKLTQALEQLGPTVAYYPRLAPALGGCKAAILVCQLFYWQGRSTDGWVYRSADELVGDTGLSYGEQTTARKQLVKIGVLETKYRRLEHQMYFKLDMDRLNEVWRDWYKVHFAKPAMPFSPNGQNPDGELGKAHFDNNRSRESKEIEKKRCVREEEAGDGASRPSSIDISQNQKSGDVKDSSLLPVPNAPTAQDALTKSSVSLPVPAPTAQDAASSESKSLLPVPVGEAPMSVANGMDPAVNLSPVPVMQPAPAQAQESTSSPGKSLADFTPADPATLVGLFNDLVESVKPRALTCGYKAWDDKFVPAILRRYPLLADFTSAVLAYAEILVSSRRATLRDFIASAPPLRSTASRGYTGDRGAIAPASAKLCSEHPPKEKTAEEILADHERREREVAERAEKARIYEIGKRMLKVYCDVLVKHGIRLNTIFWDRPLTNAESIEYVIRKHLSVLSEAEIGEAITKFAIWDARRRLEYAKSISCPATVGNSELGYFSTYYLNWMKATAGSGHSAV